MSSDEEEKDDFNNMLIILWPFWVPVVIGIIYLFFQVCKRFFIAWGQGFEPQLTASKAAVLPLDDPQIFEHL